MYKKVKINFFEEKSIFSAGFIELKYMWLQTGLVVLKKQQQTLGILCLADFLSSFLNITELFENCQ